MPEVVPDFFDFENKPLPKLGLRVRLRPYWAIRGLQRMNRRQLNMIDQLTATAKNRLEEIRRLRAKVSELELALSRETETLYQEVQASEDLAAENANLRKQVGLHTTHAGQAYERGLNQGHVDAMMDLFTQCPECKSVAARWPHREDCFYGRRG